MSFALLLGLSLVIFSGAVIETLLFWLLGFDWPAAAFLATFVVSGVGYMGYRRAQIGASRSMGNQ